ncbi:ABC transporter ATP-binding protein [Paucibacter sp. APW11]|uniref:ABC transporter ATP-binding protein n=1 Tax=Roseateles aquae TaxID=3077235 RepID=A0ABU3PBC3_9BURK|nr:ABC transporter ATP-binding protein [Paucibacter sp. APW11]MDT8999861.1 ABC transporter ATP-binding protein [Paucibacter sp. APW11]
MDTPTPLFRLRQVHKRYRRESETVTIFDGLSMDIPAGDFLAIMGPSGSGKTTMLNLLGGIDRIESGELWFKHQRLDQLGEAQLSQWRAENIGFVFQHYNLLPMLNVARNVELPLMLGNFSAAQRRERVQTALELVGLASFMQRLPSQLSGGQQQRVAIARAIVANSELILCDEPTGNLDRQASGEILETLQLLNQEFGKTIVMVTHDPRAAAVARRHCCLDKGQFVDQAAPALQDALHG